VRVKDNFYRSRLLLIGLAFLPAALMLVVSACGGDSSRSSTNTQSSSAGGTQSASATATPAVSNMDAQAPLNGIVAIFGKPGVAPGEGTVQATRGSTSGCGASGKGTAHPDGSFVLSVCAEAGDSIDLTYVTDGTSLGSVTVPSSTTLPTCPSGFRTVKFVNNEILPEVWFGYTGGAPKPQNACATDAECGSGQRCGSNGKCYYSIGKPGETTACSASCPGGSTCSTSMGLCEQATPPDNQLEIPGGGTVVACEPNVEGLNIRTFARAKCQPDGTLCEIGDCLNGSYKSCKPDKGVMTSTVAEYELEKNSYDTYDVSVLNGPTFSAQVAPEPSSKPSPAGSRPYQKCGTAGSTSAQPGGLLACSWNFVVSNIAGADQTAILTQITLPSCASSSCPAGSTCQSMSLNGGTGQKVCIPNTYPSCSSSSDCTSSPFGNTCGTIDVNNGLYQTCGSATGALWTYATLCGIPNSNNAYGPVDCYASNGQGGELRDLFACANKSGGDASAGDSCYTTPGPECCGCPTFSPSGTPWNGLPLGLTNCSQTNTEWENQVLPWIDFLKSACSNAYAFQYDDATVTFNCQSAGTSSTVDNMLGYNVTFAPMKVNGAIVH
jgi:hypothetical protein